jgi:H+/Cl- antiporter ClcA
MKNILINYCQIGGEQRLEIPRENSRDKRKLNDISDSAEKQIKSKSFFRIQKQNQKYWDTLTARLKVLILRAWYFIRHPKISIRWLMSKHYFMLNFIAILSGFIGAGAAWLLSVLISGTRILFYGVIYDKIPVGWKWTMILLFPTLAAAITAPFLIKWAPEARGHGIPEVMESLIYKDGYIKTSTPILKLFLSGIGIGGGLSLGREGPIAQIGAGFSSLLGRKAGLKDRNIQIIVVCGLVAGLSATFNAPIGGVIFGIEVLLISMSAQNLIPVIMLQGDLF